MTTATANEFRRTIEAMVAAAVDTDLMANPPAAYNPDAPYNEDQATDPLTVEQHNALNLREARRRRTTVGRYIRAAWDVGLLVTGGPAGDADGAVLLPECDGAAARDDTPATLTDDPPEDITPPWDANWLGRRYEGHEPVLSVMSGDDRWAILWARRAQTPTAGAVLQLEAIGWRNWRDAQPPRDGKTGIRCIDMIYPDEWTPPRWSAAEITLDPQGGLARRYARPHYDFSRANSAGSRGVRAVYILSEGGCYDVHSPRTWHKTDHYFCVVRDGQVVKVGEEEVRECLKSRLASMF